MSASVRELALAVLLPGFVGTTPPAWLLEALDEGLAGVGLFGHNVEDAAQVRTLTDAMRDRRASVLVAADEEGGSVTRLDVHEGSPWPGAAALGALDDTAATRQVGRGIGAQARAAGVDLIIAPVFDVNSEPDNPVIGVRSFGATAELASRHGVAFSQGLADAGVAACAKHFPGHGATRTDSHLGLPVLDVDEATWRERDLAPFVAAVAAGVPSMMTAHVVVRALDDRPATLSARILGLLREELGYTGAIVTDALDMAAIADTVGRGPGAAQALAAGADLVCVGNPSFPGAYDDRAAVEEVVGAIVAAVADGTLSRERLEEAAGRVAALAEVTRGPRPEPTPWADRLELGAELAARALTVTGDVRLGADAVVLVPPAQLGMAAGRIPSALLAELHERRPHWRQVPVADPASAAAAATGDVLIVVEGSDPHHDLVRAVLERAPDAVVAYTGLRRADDPGARTLHTHGPGAASARAAAQALAGTA
jgi:beta-N-acetylhexosaminidase